MRVHATASRSDGNGAGAADAVSLSDRAQRTLREAILRGDIAPGTKLLITDTAAQLGVSPIPLREALRALEAEGLVDISAHRGAQVRPLSRSDMESIYALRVDLDGMATRLACERNEPGWLEHVKECLNELAVISPENRDRDNTEQAHGDFHMAIYAGCGSPWLIRFTTLLYHASERYRRMPRPFRGEPADLLREHQQIVHWLEEGEAEHAARLMQNHVYATVIALRKRLPNP